MNSQSIGGTITLPALIDCHVHFREPGFPEKATMATEAASAVAGGVHTVCEMPNTNPPTVTIAALADKVRRASEIKDCDIRFFFGCTEAAHLETLKELWTGESDELTRLKARCCGVKLYLDHSTGNQKIDGGIIKEVFSTCAELKIPIIAHCEDSAINDEAQAYVLSGGSRTSAGQVDVSLHSLCRPVASETKSIIEAIAIARETGAALHVAHLTTANGIDLVRDAKKEGLPITCEVAPHHLFLTVEDYDTLGTFAKMNPPLRTMDNRDALWEGIADATVDCIATDHAPHTIKEKQNAAAPFDAPSGVPGVETMLPLLLSVANGHWPHPTSPEPRTKNYDEGLEDMFTLEDITRLCFTNPNRIFNLGKDGSDTITIDLDAPWTIKGSELHSKCGWTPYEGWEVVGKVVQG